MAELFATYPLAVWGVLLATGVLIGLLAGLLGVGGGGVAVPVLLEIFETLGMAEPAAVALAVGTAQASILIASATAAAAHWRAGTVDRTLVRAWLPALVAGTALGLVLASFASTKLLTGLFAAAAAGLALKMAIGDRMVLARPLSEACSAPSPGRGGCTRLICRHRWRNFEHTGAVSLLLAHQTGH